MVDKIQITLQASDRPFAGLALNINALILLL